MCVLSMHACTVVFCLIRVCYCRLQDLEMDAQKNIPAILPAAGCVALVVTTFYNVNTQSQNKCYIALKIYICFIGISRLAFLCT
jgi:hypothetical protein